MSSIRVFLVDDTAVIRRVLTQILEEEPDIVVAGTATNGAEALQRLPRVEADIIVLDVEMPGMGGLDMLRELRRLGSTLPVLLFSSVTERGAMVTIEALLLGANDYVTKPSMLGSANAARDHIRLHLLPRIRHLSGRKPPVAVAQAPAAPAVPRVVKTFSALAGLVPGTVDAVVIGVSTGGPIALGEMVPKLIANLPVPVFIVQHMPAFFTRALSQRLSKLSQVPVIECEQPQLVEPGTVWLAAGGQHMVLERDGLSVIVRPDYSEPVNFCRPSADVLFRSAAKVYGARTLAVVMTGMGQDGLEGARAVREAGGQVLIQDELSSVVWGMPGAVHQAGLANQVLPLDELAGEIMQRLKISRPWFCLPEPEFIPAEGAQHE